jgi:hypothetical protein
MARICSGVVPQQPPMMRTVFGHAAVALGDQDVAGLARGAQVDQGGHELGRADAAVAAIGRRARA